jgi:C1A family cysteine protease
MIDGSSSSFKSYKKGIFVDTKCSTSKVNTALLVVGFDSESSGFPKKLHHYWKAKNSLGTAWGESGYIHIERIVGDTKAGTCGINTLAYYPIG